MHQRRQLQSLAWGTAASLLMAGFYFGIMRLTMSTQEVWYNFVDVWYLLSIIIVGFGIQIGLWVYARKCHLAKAHGALPGVSGAASGTSMVACCLHHLADVTPLLGLSGASIFLSYYQKPLLILGASINILAVAYMLKIISQVNPKN